MSALIYPPIRDRYQRCTDCDRWSPHAVSASRPADGGNAARRQTVRCLACGTKRVDYDGP